MLFGCCADRCYIPSSISKVFYAYLVWGMRRACTASRICIPDVTWLIRHKTDNMQHTRYIRTAYEYCHQVSWHSSSVLHYVNFETKQQHRQQCCSPSDHTTQCATIYIANCSYDTYNATMLGDVKPELANATTYDCVIRAGRKRSKIEIEIAILAISIKDRDRRRIFPIFDPDNRGEDRSLWRRSRSRSPTPVV